MFQEFNILFPYLQSVRKLKNYLSFDIEFPDTWKLPKKFVDEKKVDTAAVNVFYTTTPYFNYNWSVHADMPAALREKITKALLDLNANTAQGKEILQLNRATRYVPTKPENYKGLETAAKSAGLL